MKGFNYMSFWIPAAAVKTIKPLDAFVQDFAIRVDETEGE